jgi:hypothetical protein
MHDYGLSNMQVKVERVTSLWLPRNAGRRTCPRLV